MVNLTLLQWHPYSNRILEIKSTLSGYTTGHTHVTYPNEVNFKPRDGIDTKHTIGSAAHPYNDAVEYDYLLVTDEEDNIVSRWYIIESYYNRAGQRILTLHRDLLADNWNAIKGDPFYCEKGIVPADDDFIFANEPLQFNKYLSSVIRLQEYTHPSDFKGYAVAYVASNYTGGTYTQEQTISYPTYNDLPSKLREMITTPVNTRSICDTINYYISGSNNKNGLCADGHYRFWHITFHPISKAAVTVNLIDNLGPITVTHIEEGDEPLVAHLYAPYDQTGQQSAIESIANYLNNNFPYLTAAYYNSVNVPLTPEEAGYDGFTYLIQSGAEQGAWRVTQSTTRRDPISTHYYYHTPYGQESDGDVAIADAIRTRNPVRIISIGGTTKRDGVFYGYDRFRTATVPSPTTVGEYTISVPNDLKVSRPYNAFYFVYNDSNYELAKVLPRDLADNLYDIQLVGYEPRSTKYTTTTIGSRTVELNWIEEFNTNYACNVNYSASGNNEIKRKAITETMRIVAPDNSAMLDFTPVKAGKRGNFAMTVRQDLEPYATQYYIHGSFTGLYGTNPSYGTQGLKYSLSCSFPRATSQWASYKANNMAYQNIFNRQIENMETMHGYEMGESGVAAISNAVGTAAMGMAVAGPIGAAVGGLVSAAGGIADQFIAEDKFKESLDYTKDQFAFNIMNISSRPNTYSGGSVFMPTNSLFAKLEIYTATDKEIDAWNEYQKYNAWTIGKITTLNQMATNASTYSSISKFIKGYLCRCSLHEDNHVINQINEELMRGVYVE